MKETLLKEIGMKEIAEGDWDEGDFAEGDWDEGDFAEGDLDEGDC